MFDGQPDAVFRCKQAEYKWYRFGPDFQSVKPGKVRAICFTEDEKVCRLWMDRKYRFPGGRILKGAPPRDVAQRKAFCEAALVVYPNEMVTLGASVRRYLDDHDDPFNVELYYAAPIRRVLPFIDTDQTIRYLISWDRFHGSTPNDDVLWAINDCAAKALQTFTWVH